MPPHLWRGGNAFQAWAADLEADSKKQGMTGAKVTIVAPSRSVVGADAAYIVVPATYTYTQGGKAMKESAHMVFALKKRASGWLIHGWTWSGTKPVPATP